MITFLIILGYISAWIFIGMMGYKIFLKAWYNDKDYLIFVSSFVFAPIAFIWSIFYYFLFKKNPPPINWYKWWDLVEYEGKRAIVVGKWWVTSGIKFIIEWEDNVREKYSEYVSPIISWEMKDTLEYVQAVNEFEKATKELEEKASKVKSMRDKVKTIFDKK